MPRKKSPPKDVLAALTGDEGLAVLRALLAAHPELGEEAQALATRRLVTVDRRRVADAVVASIDALGLEDLGGRAGRQVYGYVEPGEAAWEILEEAVAPFTSEIGRLLALGLEDAARAQCEGVLIGLHEVLVDHCSNELVQYAPDFPGEAAGAALGAWMAAPGGPRRLDQDLLHEELYEWVDLVGRMERNPPRKGTRARP